MVTRMPSCLSFRYARLAWTLAWLALLLNAVAPVIAYAFGLGHVRHALEAPAAPEVYQHHADHHGMPDAEMAPSDRPTTPHCQYCLDFAAGVPLWSILATVPHKASVVRDVSFARQPTVYPRPLSRLAYPRGPPSLVV